MNYRPSLYERDIIRSFARVARDSVQNFQKNIYDFLEKAVQTPLFLTFVDDYTLHSQSPNCIIHEFLKQCNVKEIENKEHIEIDAEAGYWMGYLIMFWCIKENFPMDYIKKIDMEQLYWNYDVYHTLDVNGAIERVKENILENHQS